MRSSSNGQALKAATESEQNAGRGAAPREHSVPHQIVYEHPLNERVRTFLRLEHLFQQLDRYLPGEDAWASRAALSALLDVTNVFGRGDIKSEILKELERHNKTLSNIRQKAGVNLERLGDILDQLEALASRVHGLNGQLGKELRENSFLKNIMHRSSIPGGNCAFDLPMYHYWLQQPHEARLRDLDRWMTDFGPIRESVALILQLVRTSSHPRRECAEKGFFHQALDTQLPVQLVRVSVAEGLPYFAEISGGKHRFTVRFMSTSEYDRPTQTEDDVTFELTSCVI